MRPALLARDLRHRGCAHQKRSALPRTHSDTLLAIAATLASQNFHHLLQPQQSSTRPAFPAPHTASRNNARTSPQTAHCAPHSFDSQRPCPAASDRSGCNTQTADRRALPPSNHETCLDHARLSTLLTLRLSTSDLSDRLCRASGCCFQ